MQFSSINSLSTFNDASIAQSAPSFASTSSAYPLPMIFTGNTEEVPLTLSTSQAILVNEDFTLPPLEMSILLNAQLQHEYNQQNFWQEFHNNITEDRFKEKILDYIKNDWGLDSSLKQNLNDPILEIRKDIQYQLLLDILFQLRFTFFINLIATDVFNFIQTEKTIQESSNLNDLELIIAKHDVTNIISSKIAFIFNIYKDHLNRKNQVLSQDTIIRLILSLTDELQQAETENLASQIDSNLYAIILPKIESLFTQDPSIGSSNASDDDELNLIMQSIDIPSSIETELLNPNVHPVTHISNEALQASKVSSDEQMLKCFLESMFKENIEYHEQILFSACKQNHPLKEKYLSLTTLALQVIKGCQQIKTWIAKLSLLDLTEYHQHHKVAQLKGFFYGNLASLLTNFTRYYQLMMELQPHGVQILVKLSVSDLKKTHLKIANRITELKRQLANSRKKYYNQLNRDQATKANVVREMPLYLTEQRAMKIIQQKFANLSIDKIKDIIFYSEFTPQPEDHIISENVTKILQESIESDEALNLKFLLTNIFTHSFYCDEQLLYKAYNEDHPEKEKYLTLMMTTLNAKKACLQIKTRIAQLESFQSKDLIQKEKYDSRSMKLIKNILCKSLTELLTNASSYYQLLEELKPSEFQEGKKVSVSKMKKINTSVVKKIHELKLKIKSAQQYYNIILEENQITSSHITQNVLRHLNEKEIISTFQERFSALSENKIKEIIISTKITPQNEDNISNERTNISLNKRNEQDETSILESLLVNIFTIPYYHNEELFFNAYVNNDITKEDCLSLLISAMQAKGACIKIKTRILQLINFEQKKDSRECDISSVKNYLYRDLTELFITSSDYYRLMDKLNQPRVRAKTLKNMSLKQVKMLDKEVAEQIRQKKNQLRSIQNYYNLTNRTRTVKESQIIHGMLVYLTEQKAIKGFEKKFPSLTVDKIKEIITRSVLTIAKSKNNDAMEANSNKKPNQNGDSNLAPAAKKRCTSVVASASNTLLESTDDSVLKFNAELTAKKPSQSAEIHFPSPTGLENE